jgi:hypothetical protein
VGKDGNPYIHPPVEGKPIRGFEGLDDGDRVCVQVIGTDKWGRLYFLSSFLGLPIGLIISSIS